MTTRAALTVCALGVMGMQPRIASSQCPQDANPCYELLHYTYQGGDYCRRYYSGSLRYIGNVGSVTGFSQPQIGQLVFDAYSNWYFNTALNVSMESAASDTSGTNARVAVIDNSMFTSNWGSAS